MPTVDSWDQLGARYTAAYDTLYGQVRTHVLHHHLLEHLPPPPAEVIDIGGGAGHQSIELALAGYDVTILDSSPSQLQRAEAHVKERNVTQRLTLTEATAEDALSVVGQKRFAGVLCHGVLQYVPDYKTIVQTLCALAAPNGIVSIMAYNLHWYVMRAGQAYDWESVIRSLEDSGRGVNWLGAESRGYDPEEISQELRANQVDPIAYYGVRTFTENWSREHGRVSQSDPVLKAELLVSRLPRYRDMSRSFHLVGKRRQSVLGKRT